MENKNLILRHLDLSWNQGDFDRIKDFLSDTFYYKTTFTDEILNTEQYIEFINTLRNSIPDISVTIELIMQQDNNVMTQISFMGEVVEPFYGIPASSRIITFPAISIWEVSEDKIRSADTLIDITGISRQLGLSVSPQIPLDTR